MITRVAARTVHGRSLTPSLRGLSSLTSHSSPSYGFLSKSCSQSRRNFAALNHPIRPLQSSSRPQILSLRYASNKSQKPPPSNEDDIVNQPEFTEEPPSNRPRRSNKLRPEAEPSVDRAQQSTNASASDEAQNTSPTGPLPDLTKGIPSTFEQEFAEKNTSFKDQETENPSLNLTEDPAQSGNQNEEDFRPKEEYVSSIERRRNALARYLYLSMAAFLLSGSLLLGQNWDEDEAKKHPDVPSGWNPAAVYGRIKARLSSTLGYYTEPAFPKLLPDLDASMKPPYTLVLSLEDLLVSSKWNRATGWEVAKRPGVDYFLRYLSQYYELVIFTSVQMMNADLVIRKLDPYHVVMWPLFREATRYMNGEHVKDLSYLNRDLSKTLIIDTVPGHVQLQPENAIVLPKWTGQPGDAHSRDLIAMIPFLEYIATMSVPDVRKFIQSFEGCEDVPAEFARRESRAREAFNKKRSEEFGGKKGKGGALSGLSSKLGFGSQQIPGEQSPEEAYAQGKTLSDQYRERGIKNYQMLEKEIRENGEKWLKEMEAEEKKAQEEQMKSMQSGMSGMFDVRSWFGGGSGDKDNKDGK